MRLALRMQRNSPADNYTGDGMAIAFRIALPRVRWWGRIRLSFHGRGFRWRPDRSCRHSRPMPVATSLLGVNESGAEAPASIPLTFIYVEYRVPDHWRTEMPESELIKKTGRPPRPDGALKAKDKAHGR